MRDLLGEHRAVTQNNFRELYDRYLVFCKKLHFLIKGALTNREELLALEIILDYLDRNERDIEELRARNDEKSDVSASESFEVLLGRLLMENEDYQLLHKIAEARRKGGPNWEALKSILNINNPHSTLDNSDKSV
ncbi:MAG TPA: hypothetical protein VEF34_06470 [Syntrophobacteraceae bacterium]|nr:hypothetical protein [Syntrophobacteraceae bacterium]